MTMLDYTVMCNNPGVHGLRYSRFSCSAVTGKDMKIHKQWICPAEQRTKIQRWLKGTMVDLTTPVVTGGNSKCSFKTTVNTP